MVLRERPEDDRQKLLVQGARVGLYLLVVLLTVINHLVQKDFYNWELMKVFYGLSLVGLGLHSFFLIRPERLYGHRTFLFASFVFDLIIVTLMLHWTQLNQSLFLFMYLVVLLLGGLVFKIRGGVMLAAISSVVFSAISLLSPDLKSISFVFILILNNIAFFAVASMSGYLSEQLNIFSEKLQASHLSLEAARRLNELIVETFPAGLLTINFGGRVLKSNPGAERIFFKGLEGLDFFNEVLPFQESWREGVRTEIPWEREGFEKKLLGVQVLPQSSEGLDEKTYLVVVEDLTQIRKYEMALRQSEKMAAIGQLAAGIAHEIRNPLAGISGSVQLLSSQFQSEDDKKLSKIIMKEIDRLNNLISEFLDFAKPESLPVEPVMLEQVVREVLEHVQAGSGRSVSVMFHGAPRTEIRGQRDKLKQAFLNIITNSFQAMESKDKPELTVSVEKTQDLATVIVKDNGCGMTAETRNRMFEPFHTTKPKGTGLGLAITHKILMAHQAQVNVESSVGLGTEFIIHFPLKTAATVSQKSVDKFMKADETDTVG